jgi:hypothetical protein
MGDRYGGQPQRLQRASRPRESWPVCAGPDRELATRVSWDTVLPAADGPVPWQSTGAAVLAAQGPAPLRWTIAPALRWR